MSEQQSPSTDFTLVLPLYNEGAPLEKSLKKIHSTLQKGQFTFHMILIDDCSKDETPARARMFADTHDHVTFIQHEANKGRGGTVMDGFSRSRSSVIGYMDVDCEVSPIYLLEFVPDLLSGKRDVITGLRIYRFTFSRMIRTISSVGYRMISRWFLGIRLRDSETGYKLFRSDRYHRIAPLLKNSGWFWDTEVMVASTLARFRIEERPVLFLRNTSKQSSVRLLHDTVEYLKELFRFRKRLPYLKEQLRA